MQRLASIYKIQSISNSELKHGIKCVYPVALNVHTSEVSCVTMEKQQVNVDASSEQKVWWVFINPTT